MKNDYKLLSDDCGLAGGCPAVVEKGEEILVIGSLLTSNEEETMKKSVKVGVSSHEGTVRIPRDVFNQAVNRYLTAKKSA